MGKSKCQKKQWQKGRKENVPYKLLDVEPCSSQDIDDEFGVVRSILSFGCKPENASHFPLCPSLSALTCSPVIDVYASDYMEDDRGGSELIAEREGTQHDGPFQLNKASDPITLTCLYSPMKNGHLMSSNCIDLTVTPAVSMTADAPMAPKILCNSQKENCTSQVTGHLIQPLENSSYQWPPQNLDMSVCSIWKHIKQPPLDNAKRSQDLLTYLPAELILKVFSFLSRQGVSRCLRVCRRWRLIGSNELLWRRIDLGMRKIKSTTITTLFKRGTLYLRLSRADIEDGSDFGVSFSPSSMETPVRGCSLRYLDLSMATLSACTLEETLAHCKYLRKLSLEHVSINDDVLMLLSQNRNLDTLNLSMSGGFTVHGIVHLIEGCYRLESLNLAWTDMERDCVSFLCTHLPGTVRCLNVSGCRQNISDADVSELVYRCPLMETLDVSDNKLTDGSVRTVCENLPSLRELCVSRCYDVTTAALRDLACLHSLRQLTALGMLSEEAFAGLKAHLRRHLPDIVINTCPVSSVARPTIGWHRTSIWGQKVERNEPCCRS